LNRRDQKQLDKREQAVQRVLQAERDRLKNDRKSKAAEDQMKEKIHKAGGKDAAVDSDLASSDEEDDDDDEDDEDEDQGDSEDGEVDEDDDGSEYGDEEDEDDEEGEYDDEDEESD
jgi:hypothetical protein